MNHQGSSHDHLSDIFERYVPAFEQINGKRWAIIGASGWIGSNLVDFGRRAGAQVSLFGSKSRTQNIAGCDEFVEQLNTARIMSEYFDTIWDCAFMTREKLAVDSSLLEVNELLMRSTTSIAGHGNYGSYLYISSGASQIKTRTDAYSDQKLRMEMGIADIARTSISDLRIIRLWNATGPYCKKRQYFAITSMLDSARRTGTITIDSQSLVWRRYMAIPDLVAGVILDPIRRREIDSGGHLVELGDLADKIFEYLRISPAVQRTLSDPVPDVYLSNATEIEEILVRSGIVPLQLADQLRLVSR